jgi:hypothetical protein
MLIPVAPLGWSPDYTRYQVDMDWDALLSIRCKECGEFAGESETAEWTLASILAVASEHETAQHS